jgi:hypothetical protein
LPEILRSKREEVVEGLGNANGVELIAKALEIIPLLRARFEAPPTMLLAGFRHRFELVTAVVTAAEHNRRLAAAILLTLGELQHHIAGSLRLVGLIDEDLVVRVALNELDEGARALTRGSIGTIPATVENTQS